MSTPNPRHRSPTPPLHVPRPLLITARRRFARLPATLIVLAVLFPARAEAQRADVTGVVVDSVDVGLPGATVVLLQPADSVAVASTSSGPDGAFRARGVPTGRYLLRISFVGYSAHTSLIEVGAEPVDVGRIRLVEAPNELGQLVVGAERVEMVVRGDTLAYDAAAFRVPPGSTVEDLLKRLPGVEVDRDGRVTAQGQPVGRVLVDGKEFFGGDPTVATRNLPAEAVDEVEVYDKASDTAEFTGVADGNEERTINLTLNEDHRTGQFGSVTGGVGDAGGVGTRYDGRASGNRFSPTTQVSLLGNVNNVNRNAYSIEDYVEFMGGPDALMDGGGGFTIGGDGIPVGGALSDGYAATWSGGINLNHEFTDATSIQSSYLAHRVRTERSRSIVQDRLTGPTASSRLALDSDQSDATAAHRASVRLDHTFGEGHDLRVRSGLRATGTALDATAQRQTSGLADGFETASTSGSAQDRRALAGDASLTYRRRFGSGRSVVVDVEGSLDDAEDDVDLVARNRFFQADSLLSTEAIDRLQSQAAATASGGVEVLLTQPLGEDRALQLSVEGRETREDQDRRVLDRTGGTPTPDVDLSAAYERASRIARAGVDYRDNRGAFTWGVGLGLQRSFLDGAVSGLDAGINRQFTYVLPSAQARYQVAPGHRLNAQYRTSTREPTVRELQPLVDARDPLDVYVGNPDLRPEVSHNADLQYLRFDPATSTSLFAIANVAYAPTAISTARTVDALGRQSSTPVNAGPTWSGAVNASYTRPVRPLGIKAGVLGNAVVRGATELLNGVENDARTTQATLALRGENLGKDRVDVRLGLSATYHAASTALDARFDQRYVSQAVTAELGWTPTDDWSLRTTLDLTRYPADVFGQGRSVPLWEARVSRWFMGRRVEVELVAADLLNQNLGVTYSATPAFVQEERVDTLGRYVLLRLGYRLGAKPPGPGVIAVGT